MKTLSQLIQEAIDRLEKGLENERYIINNWSRKLNPTIGEIFKQELETIVKESFKNTRVEEKQDPWAYGFNLDMTAGYNQALEEVHNKECEFLGD